MIRTLKRLTLSAPSSPKPKVNNMPTDNPLYAEIDRLRAINGELVAALEGIILSRDKNGAHREHFVQDEQCDYWSPAASMIDSEYIAAARAVLAKSRP